jgi:hypothetical protein
VEDHARGWVAGGDRVGQRVSDQAGAQVADYRVAAPQFAANMAALPTRGAGGRATEQVPGRVRP